MNGDMVRLASVHKRIPRMVGIRIAAAVHFRLPVSFLMVRQVVEQGQWKRQKIIMHRAVFQVQPWDTRRFRRAEESLISTRYPVCR